MEQPFNHSQPAVRKFSSAIQPLHFCHLKTFLSCSAVQLPSFKNFPQLFNRLTSAIQKLSSAIQLFDFSAVLSCSAVQHPSFKNFPQLFNRLTSAIQKLSSAIQLFDFCQSKMFLSHWTYAIKTLSSAVQHHPFKNCLEPFKVTILNSLRTRFLSVHLPCVQLLEQIP